jgi:hypothetical protein
MGEGKGVLETREDSAGEGMRGCWMVGIWTFDGGGGGGVYLLGFWCVEGEERVWRG